MRRIYWRIKYKAGKTYKSLLDFLWVAQALLRGKILHQKAYRFYDSGKYVCLPEIKMSVERINKLAKWNGYRLLDAGMLRVRLGQNPPYGDCSAFVIEEWFREWPQIGQLISGEGTHGEAHIADPPHFLILRT